LGGPSADCPSLPDLNKKEFKDRDHDTKATIKGKTADKVEYEANFGTGEKYDAAVTMPITADVTGTCKVDGADLVKTVKYKASDALNVTTELTFKEGSTDKLAVKLNAEYVDPQFSVEFQATPWDTAAATLATETTKKSAMKTATTGMSVAIAAPVPGVEGVTMGIQPGLGFRANGRMCPSMPMSLGYAGKDFQLALCSGLATLPDQVAEKDVYVNTGVGLKGYFKKSDTLAFAFEVDQTNVPVNAKAIYDSSDPKKNNGIKASTKAQFGLETKWDAATVKAKATLGGASPVYDFAYKTKFGSGSVSLAYQVADKNTVGMVYTLE